MAIESSKPQVDESSLMYQARTALATLGDQLAAIRDLSSPKAVAKIKQSAQLVAWLQALDYKQFLTKQQREQIWYKLIEISGIYDFPTAPVLSEHPRPTILIGGGGSSSSGGGTGLDFVSNLLPLFTSSLVSTTLSFSQIAKPQNTIFAGPISGADTNPDFRALVVADIPSLSTLYLPLTLGGNTTVTLGGNALTFQSSAGGSVNLLSSSSKTIVTMTETVAGSYFLMTNTAHSSSDSVYFSLDLDNISGAGAGAIFGDTRGTPKGIQYAGAGYVTQAHSLADKAYVDAATTGFGTGSVTSVAWTTSQGVSASITNPTTTPNITITLGALTGVTSFNGLVITANTGVVTTGTWSATTIAPTKGGTGLTAVSTGDLLYGSASNTWAALSDIATGNALISGGVGVAPLYGKIGLTTHISGLLPLANGGLNTDISGGGAIGDHLQAASATTFSRLTSVAAGSYLRSGGVNTLSVWSTLTLPNAATSGAVFYANATNTMSSLAPNTSTVDRKLMYQVNSTPAWGTYADLEQPTYGAVYSDNFGRVGLGSNYTQIGGTATFTVSSNLVVSGGVGDLNQFIMYNQLKTNLEQWTRTVTISSVGTLSASSYGIALGCQSQGLAGGVYLWSLQCGINLTTSGGEIYWWGQSTGTINSNTGNFVTYAQQSPQKLSVSTGDALSFKMVRNKNVFYAFITNTTTGRTIQDTFMLQETYPLQTPGTAATAVSTPNCAYFSIYAIGGTQTITSDVVTSECSVGADVLFCGDSILGGYYTSDVSKRSTDLIDSAYYGNFNSYCGTGDRIEDLNTTEIIALAPKKIVVMAGAINVLAGDSAATYKTKRQTFNTALTNAGYVVGTTLFYCLLTGQTTDVTPYNADIISDYPTGYIDTFTPFRNGTGTGFTTLYSPDGLHGNQLAHQKFAAIFANKFGFVRKSNADYSDIPLYQTTGWQLGGTSNFTSAVLIEQTTTAASTLKFHAASLGSTPVDGKGLWLYNDTAAANGAQQISPAITFEGRGWAVTGSSSQVAKFREYVLPVQAAGATITAELDWATSINGGGYNVILRLANNGDLTMASGSTLTGTTGLSLQSAVTSTGTGLNFVNPSVNPGSVGNYTNVNTGFTFSGTASSTFNAFRIQGTINTTSTGQMTLVNLSTIYTAVGGAMTGIDYNPAVTSITGTHIAIRTTSGQLLFTGSSSDTPTASTRLDIRGVGTTTGIGLRVADSANTARFTTTDNGSFTMTQAAASSGAPSALLTITSGAHTNITAAATRLVYYNLTGIVQFTGSTGFALQEAMKIEGTTYRFVSATGTITDAITLGIVPPSGGTNSLLTNAHGLYVYGSTLTNVTNAYGLTVNAANGATNNYAAQFLGGKTFLAASASGYASANIVPGVAVSSPADGDLWYVNTNHRLTFHKNALDCEVLMASAVTTETVVSDTTLTITYNGTTYKILLKA